MKLAPLNTLLGDRSPFMTAYHHFTDEPCAATRRIGVSTSLATFREHLDYFERSYRIIGLDELLLGRVPLGAMIIGIDDSYRSVLDVAVPELKRRGLPAVLFVNPGPIANKVMPFDNLVALALEQYSAGDVARAMYGHDAEASSHSDILDTLTPPHSLGSRERARTNLLRLLRTSDEELRDKYPLFLRPEDLAAVQDAGVEIGNHTMNHFHCRALTEAELRFEIAGAKDWIEQQTRRPVRGFSFPWGRELDATPLSLKVIRESGHKGIFLGEGRKRKVRPAPDIWDRTTVSESTEWLLQCARHPPPVRRLMSGLNALRGMARPASAKS